MKNSQATWKEIFDNFVHFRRNDSAREKSARDSPYSPLSSSSSSVADFLKFFRDFQRFVCFVLSLVCSFSPFFLFVRQRLMGSGVSAPARSDTGRRQSMREWESERWTGKDGEGEDVDRVSNENWEEEESEDDCRQPTNLQSHSLRNGSFFFRFGFSFV